MSPPIVTSKVSTGASKKLYQARPRTVAFSAGRLVRERREAAHLDREFFIDNLLVRIHFIMEMIWWTGLAPWEFEYPFSGSLTSTFLGAQVTFRLGVEGRCYG